MKNLGISENQSLVYRSALALGEASVTDIARKSGMKRSTAHVTIEELLMLGLLSEARKAKRRIISAVHPRRLLQIAKLQEKAIEDSLPELVATYNAPKEKPRIQVFEGLEGIKALYRDLYQSLNNKEEALWFTRIGALYEVPEAVTEYKKMLRSITNPKIRELNYGDTDGKKWQKEMKPLQGKNHTIRLLPTDFEFGFSDNLIFGNKLVIFSLKKDVFVTVIESEDVVKTYRAMFEWAWKNGQ